MNTIVHNAELLDTEPDEFAIDADSLFSELLGDFGDGKKTRRAPSGSKPTVATYIVPPAPRWAPVARTIRVLRQLCDCGEEHTSVQGIFFEEVSTSPSSLGARRFTRLASTTEHLDLPIRQECETAHIQQCHICLLVDETFRALIKKGN